MDNTLEQAYVQIIDFLEDLEESKSVKYCFVGGILVSLYSDFRITRDIDVIISFQSSNFTLTDYILLLEKYNFHPLKWMDWGMTLSMAKETNKLRFLDKSNTTRYDNHLLTKFSNNNYEKLGSIGLKKRVRERIFNIESWVSSKEYFILSNLIFGGDQNYADALGCLLRFKDELDEDYLELVSNQLDIKHEYLFLKSGMDNPDDFFNRLKGKKLL